jgi:Protein of unknown function (DUF3575)
MKKIVLALSISLFAATAFAQKNVVKFNLFGAFAQSYTLAYERVLNDKMSVQLSVGYRTFKVYDINLLTTEEKLTYSGPTIVGEFRYYVTNASKDVPRGFYVAPFVRYGSYTYKYSYTDTDPSYSAYNETAKYTITSIGGGAMLGYQWLIADRVSLDVFAGPQYKSKSISNITETFANGTTTTISSANGGTLVSDKGFGGPVGARVGFNVGFAF